MASSINASTSGGGGVIVTSDATGNLNIQSGGSTVFAVTSTGVAVTGTLAATGAITGSSTVAGSTGILYPLTSGTAVASTSGTSIDFTGIPSWVKRITFMLSGVSTSGTSDILIQLGSGSVTTTGYVSTNTGFTGAAGSTRSSTAGLSIANDSASYVVSGNITIANITGFSWTSSGSGKIATSASFVCGGNVTLAGTLDRVRITTVNGTDTFDAGSVNILYE